MRLIPCRNGPYTMVDDEDYEELCRFRWRAGIVLGQEWVTRVLPKSECGVTGKSIGMHNQIMRPLAPLIVDHKDGNPFNNQRGNLVVCTKAENIRSFHRRIGPIFIDLDLKKDLEELARQRGVRVMRLASDLIREALSSS